MHRLEKVKALNLIPSYDKDISLLNWFFCRVPTDDLDFISEDNVNLSTSYVVSPFHKVLCKTHLVNLGKPLGKKQRYLCNKLDKEPYYIKVLDHEELTNIKIKDAQTDYGDHQYSYDRMEALVKISFLYPELIFLGLYDEANNLVGLRCLQQSGSYFVLENVLCFKEKLAKLFLAKTIFWLKNNYQDPIIDLVTDDQDPYNWYKIDFSNDTLIIYEADL